MKLTSSGRTLEAAMTRSPSFSRSSSSINTTMRPARMSSSSSGMVFSGDEFGMASVLDGCGARLERLGQALQVARDQVDLEVDHVAGAQVTERRYVERVRYQADRKATAIHR